MVVTDRFHCIHIIIPVVSWFSSEYRGSSISNGGLIHYCVLSVLLCLFLKIMFTICNAHACVLEGRRLLFNIHTRTHKTVLFFIEPTLPFSEIYLDILQFIPPLNYIYTINFVSQVVFLSCPPFCRLSHWGRVTHICVSKLTILGSDNGLSPVRRQAITWTNAGLLLIGPLGTNFSEILIEILTFSFKKMRLKVSSAKRRPFCLGLNVLYAVSIYQL